MTARQTHLTWFLGSIKTEVGKLLNCCCLIPKEVVVPFLGQVRLG